MGIRPARILLYGSQATGTAREGSDIDLIVISGDWTKYNHRKRLELLGVASARILEPVQAQGFTPSEIKSKKIMPFWDANNERTGNCNLKRKFIKSPAKNRRFLFVGLGGSTDFGLRFFSR